jgi:hypothetical protein
MELALDSAQSQLRGMDPQTVAKQSGCRWVAGGDGGGDLEIDFLNRSYRVSLPEAQIKSETGEEPSLVSRVLILHYLIHAQGNSLTGRWVDFRSLPGGVVYYPVFRQRVIARLIRQFGNRPERLMAAAAPLGGRAIAMADWAVAIPAFALVPVVFALWEGSEEFGPEAAVIFDDALPSYLETEDAIVACEEIIGAMKQNVQGI